MNDDRNPGRGTPSQVGPSQTCNAAPCIVVMGVSGAGKSTLASALGAHLGIPYVDADSFHPLSNVEKMQRGEPLTDEDRAGWLRELGRVMDEGQANGRGVVLACSALKATYRRLLKVPGPMRYLVYIDVDPETARRRVSRRPSHFMPSTLIDSQFAALEVPEQALVVEAGWSVRRAVQNVAEKIRLDAAQSDVDGE